MDRTCAFHQQRRERGGVSCANQNLSFSFSSTATRKSSVPTVLQLCQLSCFHCYTEHMHNDSHCSSTGMWVHNWHSQERFGGWRGSTGVSQRAIVSSKIAEIFGGFSFVHGLEILHPPYPDDRCRGVRFVSGTQLKVQLQR